MAKKLVKNYTTDELKKLVDDQTSCVSVHKSVYCLQLYPYHLTDVSSSIKELLNGKVAKYDHTLNGILLGYKNLKLWTPQGSIVSDSCFIHIEVEGDFYLFKPEVDFLLTGFVNKKSDNHVGCLVHGLFNISVPNNDEKDWAGNNVSVGDEVILNIVYMDLESRLPYIKAQLVEIKTKAQTQEEFDEESEEVTNFNSPESTANKKKKKKQIKLEENIEEDIIESDISTKKKKKKQRKSEENSIHEDNNNELNTSQNKKKKKEKQSENYIEDHNNESDTSPKKKKKKKKQINSENCIQKYNIDESGTSPKKSKKHRIQLENSILEDNINESDTPQKKNKRKSIEKVIKPEIVEVVKKVNGIESENKKKRKSRETSQSENMESIFSTPEKIKSPTKIIDNILNGEKSTKKKKERQRKEHVIKKESNSSTNLHADSIFMADSEDRKPKKRKSSLGLGQNIIWDNKELILHDPELEKTLEEAYKPPADESHNFNLVKIAALNESNKIKRNSAIEELVDKPVGKKRKRSNSEGESKAKKKKNNENKTEEIVKRTKSKKVET